MAGMATHMLLQFPALIVAGGLLAAGLSSKGRQRLDACNAHGMAGLVFAALVLAMVPRLLDLVLVDARIDAFKFAALLLCGAALRLSWQAAGTVVQGFFLGNTLPMMAIAGTLYEEAPARAMPIGRMTIPAANTTIASAAGPGIAPAFSATKNTEITGDRAWSHRRDSPGSRHAHPESPDHDGDDRSMS
jgi:hypothetical protein